jgi:hypothetical protein
MGAVGGLARGAADGALAPGVTATVDPSGEAAGMAGAGAAAFTPWGGVCGEKSLGAASRGSSAPQPRQNL